MPTRSDRAPSSARGYSASRRRHAAALAVALAALLGAACLYAAWPGVAVYDTVAQYKQALSGSYDDWHPPIMAWTWSGLVAAGLRGQAPLLVAQMALYWSGLGLLAAGFAQSRRPAGAVAVLAFGLFPLVLNWMVVVEKDAQLIAVLVAATGLVGYHATVDRRMALPARLCVGVLLAYALLVRSNAVFAVVPLALGWLDWFGLRRWWLRLALLGATAGLAIGASDIVNHRLIGASRSEVARTLPLFDLAGVATRAPLATIPHVDPGLWRHARATHCYTPFYWDPFGDADRCGAIGDAVVAPGTDSPVFRDWLAAIAAHPLAYAQHRLAHLNATMRVFAPTDEPSSAAPSGSEPNDIGLGSPSGLATTDLAHAAAWSATTPFGSPAIWLIAALCIGWTWVSAPAQPLRRVGSALALSSIALEASFAIVSIASDFRYHLWAVVGTALAGVLLIGARQAPPSRRRYALVAVLAAAGVSAVLRELAPVILM